MKKRPIFYVLALLSVSPSLGAMIAAASLLADSSSEEGSVSAVRVPSRSSCSTEPASPATVLVGQRKTVSQSQMNEQRYHWLDARLVELRNAYELEQRMRRLHIHHDLPKASGGDHGSFYSAEVASISSQQPADAIDVYACAEKIRAAATVRWQESYAVAQELYTESEGASLKAAIAWLSGLSEADVGYCSEDERYALEVFRELVVLARQPRNIEFWLVRQMAEIIDDARLNACDPCLSAILAYYPLDWLACIHAWETGRARREAGDFCRPLQR